jgi:hypothetical protein
MGKTLGKMHQYKIYGSDDGKNGMLLLIKVKTPKMSRMIM